MSIYNIEDYLKRAKEFIAEGTDIALRHACLELRFSIESIVYQKLQKIGDKLPRSIYKTWQPQKALKLLNSFEPRSDQDVTLDICQPNADGSPSGEWQRIGNYKMFSAKWLNKSYNKLGKFLHLTALNETENPPRIRVNDLTEILNEIERVSTADLVLTVNSITTVSCTLCDADMYVSESQIENQATVECYNDACGAKHNLTKIDEEQFTTNRINHVSVPCKKCGSKFAIDDKSHGDIKACWNCGHEHIIGIGYASWPTTVKSEKEIQDQLQPDQS